MKYALVTTSNGITDDVKFYENEEQALRALDRYVKDMNPEHDDAGVYGPDGLVAGAENLLDENKQYVENFIEYLLKPAHEEKPIHIIGNPRHEHGFMVASPDAPLGYSDSAAALSDLGQMRKDYGSHLKLYRVVPVTEPVATKSKVVENNTDSVVEDFDYSLIEEYIEKENGGQTK